MPTTTLLVLPQQSTGSGIAQCSIKAHHPQYLMLDMETELRRLGMWQEAVSL